jgi:hypothetical protein
MVNNSSENIMNIEQFNKYLSNINKLDSNSSVLLDELISQYPYFQTARILYLKSLHNQKNIKFEEQLKITASYVNDRKILYRLLNDPFFLQDEIISEKSTKEEAVKEKIENIIIEEKPKLPIQKTDIRETKTKDTLTPQLSSVQASSEHKEKETEKTEKLVKVETVEIKDHSTGSVKEIKEYKKNQPEKTKIAVTAKAEKREKHSEPKKTLADEILNKVTEIQNTRTTIYPTTEKESIADIILKKYKNKTSPTNKASEKPIVSKQKKKVEDNIIKTRKEDIIPKKTDTKSSIKIEKEPVKEKKKELLHFDFEKDTKEFKEQDLKAEEQIITKPYSIDNFFELDTAKTKDSVDSNMLSFAEWMEQIQNTKFKKEENKSFKKENKKGIDLINRFINSDPTIHPLRENLDYHYQQDIADSDIDNEEEFITETLAGIYIKQKFYDKAISVYKKLILKYPEKNIYFANQIKKIKKLIKNK